MIRSIGPGSALCLILIAEKLCRLSGEPLNMDCSVEAEWAGNKGFK